MNDSNIVQFPQAAESAPTAPEIRYLAEYDNGRSYSDAYHCLVGVFSTPELAMAYCQAENAERYERMTMGRDWEPFCWEGEWTALPAVTDGAIQYGQYWTHGEVAPSDYNHDHGGYCIRATTVDPPPPTPEP